MWFFDMIFQMQVKKELWRSYHWQIQNRVKTQEELERFLRLLPEEIEGIRKTTYPRTGWERVITLCPLPNNLSTPHGTLGT